MKALKKRTGYIFLLSVLLVGVLALMATVSLLLLSWSDEQAAVRAMRSSQALELARSCMDVAALKARSIPGYAGGEMLSFSTGTCEILTIQGAGAAERTMCTRGVSGTMTKILYAVFTQLYAQTKVSEYKEVLSLADCGGFGG